MNDNNDNRLIRVHTGEGKVYARIMETMGAPLGLVGPMYAFIEQVEVPEGLTQQEVVNHFRAQGWTVEQDNGTDDFNDPQWGE